MNFSKKKKSVLKNITHEDQELITGEFLSEHTRLTYDVIRECEKQNINGHIQIFDF